MQFDWERLGSAPDPKSFLVFLILPQMELGQGGLLIQSIKRQHPDVAIIVVIEDCGPTGDA